MVAVPGSSCPPPQSDMFPGLSFSFKMQLHSLLVCGKALKMFVEFQETVALNGKRIGPFSWAVSLGVRCHGERGIDGHKEAEGGSKVGKISADEKSCHGFQMVDVCVFLLLLVCFPLNGQSRRGWPPLS